MLFWRCFHSVIIFKLLIRQDIITRKIEISNFGGCALSSPKEQKNSSCFLTLILGYITFLTIKSNFVFEKLLVFLMCCFWLS